MHYILDGYNVLMRLPELFDQKTTVHFIPSREGLLYFLMQYHPQGRGHHNTTVVFDGYTEMKMNWGRLREEGIEVLFSDQQSADDHIVHLTQRQRHGGAWVVTDDRELALRVRSEKIKTLSVEAFVSKVVRERKKSTQDIPKKRLSATQERSITEELKRLWLKS